ncbi:MAG: hypothetical protein IPJ65_02720 [Archangiaceae bacterium]|nr:hypothetical protein [Archangiaceae bacterium]
MLPLLLLCAAASPTQKAAQWLAAFPAAQLRFDAAIGLSQLVKLDPAPPLRSALEKARAVADADADNPHRRFWDEKQQVEKRDVAAWSPSDGKVNVNRAIDEALWCDVHGLRAQSLAYLSGPMRDGGGYRSTHALWALALARERGCLDAAAFEKASAEVRAELRRAQPASPGPTTPELDLFGERLLFLLLAGERDATLDGWAKALAARQNPDGSWGQGPGYPQYHATLVATWALALARARDRNRAP